MDKAKIANIDGLTKPELDYLCEHDYIKVGIKYYISKEIASELVAQLQANGAEQSDSNCNIPLVVWRSEQLKAYAEFLQTRKDFQERSNKDLAIDYCDSL